MKKLLATILSVSLIGGAMLGLAGCGATQEQASEVDAAFDNAYKATLAQNFTVERSEGSAFEKEKAAENAEEQIWNRRTVSLKVDYESKLFEYTRKQEYYLPPVEEASSEEESASSPEESSASSAEDEDIDEFVTEERKTYSFGYKDKYYAVSQTGDVENPWSVEQYITEKDFMKELNTTAENVLAQVREELDSVSNMRNLFAEGEEAGSYVLTMGTTNLKMLTGENSVELYREYTLTNTFECLKVGEVGSTSITVPDLYKKAVDDYLAAQTPEEAPQA